jgi:hypothetical protein
VRCPPTPVPLGFVKPFIRLTLESSPAGVPRAAFARVTDARSRRARPAGASRPGSPGVGLRRSKGHDLVEAVGLRRPDLGDQPGQEARLGQGSSPPVAHATDWSNSARGPSVRVQARAPMNARTSCCGPSSVKSR